jgi:hypothetical protein
MRRTTTILVVLAATFVVAAPNAFAARANGGGIGTIDGVTPFSHFGFGVEVAGTVEGQFNCLMAGNAAFGGFEPLMKVSGTIDAGAVNPALSTAEFFGSGTLNLGPSGQMAATFFVSVTEGGPGVGTLQLTVLSPPFPVPLEHVLHGSISIH